MTYPFFGPPFTKPPPAYAGYNVSGSGVEALPFFVVAQDGTGDYTDLQTAMANEGSALYYVKGSYNFSSIAYPPVSSITIVFDGHGTITSSVPNASSMPALMAIGTYLNNGISPVHDIQIYGNGALIDLSAYPAGNTDRLFAIGDYDITNAGSHDIIVSGFEVYGGPVAGPHIGSVAYATNVNNTVTQGVYHVTVSNLYVHKLSLRTGGQYNSGLMEQGGGAYDLWQNCIVDATDGTGTPSDVSLLFAVANNGNVTHVVFDNCMVFSGPTGQNFEIQGSTNSNATLNTTFITLRNCYFISTLTAGTALGGTGGGYVDDTNGGGEAGRVNYVTFDNCEFNNVGISWLSESTVTGYVRFINCDVPEFSGNLAGRSPGQTSTITVGTSPFSFTDEFDDIVEVTGGTVTSITLDGLATGVTDGVFYVPAQHPLVVTYSAAPTMAKAIIG